MQLVLPPGIEPGPRTSEARVLSIKLWELDSCLQISLCAGQELHLHALTGATTSR